MKTLIQINTVINSGSTGRIAEDLGQIARINGWDSYIAFGRNERLSGSELIKIGTDFDMKLHGLQTRLFDRHGLGSFKATKKFIDQINKVKPDIIHLHNLHGYYINIELLLGYLSGLSKPVIWTFHDCWMFTGHCTYFDYAGCDKWKTECNHCPQKGSYPASIWLDRSTKNYKLKKKLFTSLKNLTIVAVSNWMADLVNQSFLAHFPIRVINNGIDTTVFSPVVNNTLRDKYNLKDKFIILGVANRWNHRKGLTDFLELSKNLDADIQIILIGLSTRQLKNLPKKIMGFSRTESVHELADFYNCADVFLNPTWEDNFPTTNLEALACGTPIITYRTGGSIESITLDTGLIVERGDIPGLINAISILRSTSKEYFSKPCIKRAKSLFDKNDRYMDYIRLYESLLVKKK